MEIVEGAKSPVVMVEQRVCFDKWVPGGFGTADCVVIAEGTLNIVDYKNGLGVEVSAVENPQMKMYALGALEIVSGLYDIDTVRMTIYQPRRSNISLYEMTVDDLYRWAEEELKPKAALAYEGGGEFASGEWCIFCKAKNDCRARAVKNLSVMLQYDLKKPPMLEDCEIAAILKLLPDFDRWSSDVKEYAQQEAVDGREFAGWKLVEGRSVRRYTDEQAVARIVMDAGEDPYDKKLVGITEMAKRLGKKKFEELLSGYVEKPAGKPQLVPESDARPAINTHKAARDFKEEK